MPYARASSHREPDCENFKFAKFSARRVAQCEKRSADGVDTANLFVARKCIEVAIACEAAARMTPEALNALDAHLELERRAFREGDSDAIVRLSGDFHVLLCDIAANSALKRYLEDIIARESLIIQLYKKPGYHDCSADEHALI